MNHWYEGFFNGVSMEFWRSAVSEDWTTDEIQFLVKWLKPAKGASLLDACCGFGRHALGLARLGYSVTGIDISGEAVDGLSRSAAAEGLAVRAIRGDILEIPVGGPYMGAYCLGNSFGYFDAAGMEDFVGRIAAAVRPGGRFILNTAMAAESILPDFPDREWTSAGKVTLLVENSYRAQESVIETRYVFIKDGRTEERISRHLVMTLAGIIALLERHGFRTLETFSGTEGGAFGLRSPQLYGVAEKT